MRHRVSAGVVVALLVCSSVSARQVAPASQEQPRPAPRAEPPVALPKPEQVPAPKVESPVVAVVLGKPIRERDLVPPNWLEKIRDTEPPMEGATPWWVEYRESHLRGQILRKLGERYIKEHKLGATKEEVQAFLRAMPSDDAGHRQVLADELKDLRKRLAAPGLDEAERKELENTITRTEREARGEDWPDADQRRQMREETTQFREHLKSDDLSEEERERLSTTIATNERLMNLTDEQAAAEWKKVEEEINRQVATGFIEQWKRSRAIFAKYGGRIIWQQMGIEPIEAERAWLEEQEKAGDFEIRDPALKTAFWSYWKREHPFTTEKPTGREFDQPWWEQIPKRP